MDMSHNPGSFSDIIILFIIIGFAVGVIVTIAFNKIMDMIKKKQDERIKKIAGNELI